MKGAENEREQKVAVRQHTTGRAINPRVSGWPTLKSRANIDTKTDPLHPLRYLFLFALFILYLLNQFTAICFCHSFTFFSALCSRAVTV